MGKKGLSDIVSTVLLILIVLALIAIFWFVYRSLTQRSGEELSDTSSCLKTILDATECNYQVWDRGTLNVTVMSLSTRRNAYESPLTGVQFLIEDAQGLVRSVTDADVSEALSPNATLPNITETAEFGFVFDDLFIPQAVRVAAIVGSDERVCSPLGKTLSCKRIVGNACADFDLNGEVDTRDVIAYLSLYTQRDALADLSCNTRVTTEDFLLMLEAYESRRNCQPSVCQL